MEGQYNAPIKKIYLKGIRKNLKIYKDKNSGDGFYGILAYPQKNFNKKTGQTKERYVRVEATSKTLSELLDKIRHGLSSHKNYHDRRNQDREWYALLDLKKEMEIFQTLENKTEGGNK